MLRAQLGLRVLLARQDRKVRLDLKESRALLAQPVHKVIREAPASLVQPGHRGLRESRVQQARRVQQERSARLEPQDLKGRPDLKESLAPQVRQDLRVIKAAPVPLELPALRARLVLKESQEQLDHKVLRENKESRALPARRVQRDQLVLRVNRAAPV